MRGFSLGGRRSRVRFAYPGYERHMRMAMRAAARCGCGGRGVLRCASFVRATRSNARPVARVRPAGRTRGRGARRPRMRFAYPGYKSRVRMAMRAGRVADSAHVMSSAARCASLIRATPAMSCPDRPDARRRTPCPIRTSVGTARVIVCTNA
jgi:hypothetical protein